MSLTGIFYVVANPINLSILGAHILFNMKEAGDKGLSQGMSYGSKMTISDIEFASPPPDAMGEPHIRK